MNFKGIEICCPVCQGELSKTVEKPVALICNSCTKHFPIIAGIPDLRVFPDPYMAIDTDRIKAMHLAEKLHELDFAELVTLYYSVGSLVPAQHAQQYVRGLMGSVARAEAGLAAWNKILGNDQAAITGSLLEIGCGTAPFLQAAAGRFSRLVGVDIALRWLVIAQKRLMEVGLDLPLLCACAEALPFPDGSFDRVVADSVLEHLQEQRRALKECYRVMRPAGHLFVATPNRYSLGPDPHTGIWAGGYWPERWVARQVLQQGGVPPKRQLLSATTLTSLITEAGFDSFKLWLPDIPMGQRNHFGAGMRWLIDGYQLAKRLPVSQPLLRTFGPMFQASAHKPDAVI